MKSAQILQDLGAIRRARKEGFKAHTVFDLCSIAAVAVTAVIGIAALAGGLQGRLLRKAMPPSHGRLAAAGLMLAYPRALFDYIGAAMVVVVIVMPKPGPAEARLTNGWPERTRARQASGARPPTRSGQRK
jgi:TRAP-type uncharacterized transport system fused permease subunit